MGGGDTMSERFQDPEIPLPTEQPLNIEDVLGESMTAHEEFDRYEFDENASPSPTTDDEEVVLGWSHELKNQEERLAYVKSQLQKAAELLITETKTDGNVTLPSAPKKNTPLF